jgi:hypothetical protein
MALPEDLATCVVTGSFMDPAGSPLRGTVSFTPSVLLPDPGDSVTIAAVSRTYELSGGKFTSDPLLATDSGQLVTPGWTYTVQVCLQNAQPYSFSTFLLTEDSPVDISELTPVQYVPEMGAYLPITGGTMLGPLYAAENPVAPLEVATMGYVTSITSGLAAKAACLVATAAALPANTATTLTLSANMAGTLAVDGMSPLSAGDRVLVKNEGASSAAQNNGIYVISAPGSSGTPWVLTRSSDMDTNVQVPGAYTFVQEGTANAGFGFIVSGIGPYVLGTTAIAWEQFTSTGSITAGTGLTLSGDVVSLNTPVEAGFLPAATTGAQGVIGPLPGNMTEFFRADGTWDVPPGSGLSGIVTIAEGGTGQGTQGAAITALTGAQTPGDYLRSDGTNATLSALEAADLTGTVPIGSGGTGAGSASAALTALGAVSREIAWDIVHDFGADPSGGTSSVTALNNAVTALNAAKVVSSGLGGSGDYSGSVPLLTAPPGKYLIDSTVALPSYMRMVMPGAIFYDPTNTVDLFTTTGYETVISGLRCRGGHRHIYVETSNIDQCVLRIDECEFDGAAAACIETDGISRSTDLILTRARFVTGGTGTRALKLGTGDHVQWDGGWLAGATDYFIEVTAAVLHITNVLGVPGASGGAWVKVNANANPAYWNLLTIEKFRFGGEYPKTLVEWHAAPSATTPTHLSIRGGSQVNNSNLPAVYFYDMPNVTDLANLQGMVSGGWLFTFDPSLPLSSKHLIGQESAGGVMVQADRTTDKLVMFSNASDPDTVAAVTAQLQL